MATKKAGTTPASKSAEKKAATPDSVKPAVKAAPKKAAAKKAPPVTVEPQTPSYEEIANLAHSYWVERGYAYGETESDWLRAERALAS